MSELYIAGVDIGGTWIRVAVSNQKLKKEDIKIKKVNTLKDNPQSIPNQVVELLNQILMEEQIEKSQLIGIGLASAGPMEMKEGILFNVSNLGFRTINLKKPIQTKFPGIPVYLINDCNAAVLGIHFFEANREERDNLVYVTISTGIGGGAICNGNLLLGKDGNAAEVGHIKVVPEEGNLCNCNAYGCWEAYSSGTAVKKIALKKIKEEKLNAEILLSVIENDLSKLSAKEVFKAAREGDKLSKQIVEAMIYYTKIGVGVINTVYDCSTIYFGGAMMKDKKQIIPFLKKDFEENAINFTINNPPILKVTKYPNEIGYLGALALVKYKIDSHPVVDSYNF